MSLRRISCVSAALLGFFSGAVLAGEGWYLGAGGLYTNVEAHTKYTAKNDFGSVELFDVNLNSSNFGGQVHGGYQWLFPLSYGLATLALELAGEFQSESFEETAPAPGRESPLKFQMTFDSSAVLTAKPGFFITNNLLLYGEIGAVYTQIRDIKSDAGKSTGTPGYERFGDYGSENLVGLRAGAGIDFLLSKNISIEAAWRYSAYPDFSEKRFTQPNENLQELIDVTDITTQQAFLGFHYYFN